MSLRAICGSRAAPHAGLGPPGRGRYKLRIEAQGPSGPRRRGAHDPDHAAQAEAEAKKKSGATIKEEEI